VYFRDLDDSIPAVEFLDSCAKVQHKFLAALAAVAEGPPPQFSGGGMWEAMHGSMGGYYEVRTQGPGREQFRLFCILDNGPTEMLDKLELPRPAIAVITGLRKPVATLFGESEYRGVRELGDRYKSQIPRRIAT
jgi:hypothetical protein